MASRWFPLGDDEPLFERLDCLASSGNPTRLLAPARGDRAVAHLLALGARRMRELTPKSAKQLLEWEAQRTLPVVFVSYRWREGGGPMVDLAVALVAAGFHVWLDVASVPIRLRDLDTGGADAELRSGLGRAVAAATAVHAVATEAYGVGGWMQRELEIAGGRAAVWRPENEWMEVAVERVVTKVEREEEPKVEAVEERRGTRAYGRLQVGDEPILDPLAPTSRPAGRAAST